jgi:propanol-preferring alcohol dehydrogenase
MKAYRLFEPALIEKKPIRSVEIPVPEPGPGQVRLKVSLCGACHTDLHTVEGEIHPPALPVTPGHQVVGVIEALGPGVKERKLGQRVGLPWLYSACGTCEFCQRGQENLCPNAKFTGFHVDGGYAEYLLAEADFVLPLPDGIPDEQAAPLLCAGIVGYRSLKQAEIQPGELVGLVGFGASAHLCIQVLTHWGCRVAVFTRSEEHRQHARDLGADWVGEAGQSPERALDRAVIFAPSGKLVPLMLEKLRPGGTLAINAIYMSDIPSFPYRTIYEERRLHSVANATYQDGVEFLDLAEEIGLRSTVKLYPMAQANQALDDMKHSRFNGEAVLTLK